MGYRSDRPAWSKLDDAVLIQYLPTEPYAAIGRRLNRSAEAVGWRARQLGLASPRTIGTNSVRHDYFGVLDTDLKAYLVGLLAADGRVSLERSILEIEVNSKDRLLVETTRNELAPQKQIYDQPARGQSGPTSSLHLTSQQIVTDLAPYGIVDRKTHNLTWPTTISQERERAFLLGYFDGDGSLYFGRYNRCATLHPRWVLSGTLDLLVGAAQVIERDCGIRMPRPTRQGQSTWGLATVCQKARIVDAWIHETGLGLPRKSLAFLEGNHYRVSEMNARWRATCS
jgi:hypothetical protein